MTGLPLEKSASRGIVTRDPSDIVKCKDEYWVFYTGRGVPSYHSRDLVKWERGPTVFKTAPGWIASTVPENRGKCLLGAGHHESRRPVFALLCRIVDGEE